MFFCPFCGTLLLVQPYQTGNALHCSTCRYIHRIDAQSAPLTVTHSFLHLNKTVMEDEVAKTKAAAQPALASSARAGTSGAGEAVATASGMAGGDAAFAGAEGSQIITIACQNDEQPCDSRKAYYVQLQMRSADEPATTFYKCVKCGFQWRQD